MCIRDSLHHTALYAAHIHKQRAGLEVLLVVSKPIHQRVRIQAQHHRIGPCQQRRKVLHRARGDDALFQRVTDGDVYKRQLVNGAGGNNPRATTDKEYFEEGDIDADTKSFFDLDASGVEFVFNLNFLGTLIPTQAFARQMVGREGCNIINISSMNAYTCLLSTSV